MAMKKIAVCGCSFSAPSNDPKLKGTSWGEQLADMLGWDLLHYARQGASNGAIRIMIDQCIREKVDFAVIAPTFHDRMEIPATAAPFDWTKTTTGWNPLIQQHLQNVDILNGYQEELGIHNVNYGSNNYTMICETIYTLAENFEHPYRSKKLDKDTANAVKQYINFMYDSNWKLQQDRWMIRDGIMQLHYHKIPFLLVACNIWTSDMVRDHFPDVIPDHCLTLDYKDTPAYATSDFPFEGEDPGYHGSVEGQTYLAKRYKEIIECRL
jgi:hypothetical protein